MLAAKGYRIRVRLEGSNRWVHLPGAMLHDESGTDWPRLSVLFTPYHRGGGDEDAAADDLTAYKWFGYEPRAGTLGRPSRAMSDWHYIDDVKEIEYSRPGGTPEKPIGFLFRRPAKNFRGDYEHTFDGGLGFFKTGLPALYRSEHGGVYRLELPPWATFNWRGFVYP